MITTVEFLYNVVPSKIGLTIRIFYSGIEIVSDTLASSWGGIFSSTRTWIMGWITIFLREGVKDRIGKYMIEDAEQQWIQTGNANIDFWTVNW